MDYTLFGEKKITAENLDDKYRLYFTERNIAENGIFITNVSAYNSDTPNYDKWKRVDGLNTERLISPNNDYFPYKFGVTRDGVCYIEFPSDIASLIVDGIYIKYLISNGTAGNITKYTLKKFYNNPPINITLQDTEQTETQIILSEDNVYIANHDAITNGQDPESIESAYNNYSKTVGVFETLVSLRDYIDKIYTLGHELGIVSNDIVSNRTNDVQSSFKIMTRQYNADILETQTVLKDSATYLASSLATQSALLRMPFDSDDNDPTELALIYPE